MFIFLDESGDLGFDWDKQATSRYFVITLLVCDSRDTMKAFQVAAKRTLRNKLNGKKGSRVIHELKGTQTNIEIKRYFLKHAPQDGWGLYSIALNKKRVFDNLTTKQGKKKLYNFLARLLIEKLPLQEWKAEHVTLTVDRCKNREEIKDFNGYIENHLQAKLDLKTSLHISHESSHENLCLQVVDMFCWGIARQRKEKAGCEWFREFADKVRVNELYLP